MAVGANAGGQLNVLMFEVGLIDVADGPTNGLTFPLGVHPLLTAPRDLVYVDQSRSPVRESGLGSVKSTAGRALRRVQLSGSFGVESRGLGPYIGTGEVRFHRFVNEVVRLGEALSREDVKAATDVIRGTPGLPLLIRAYDPGRHVPYVNFYDFLNEQSFSVTVRSFQHSIHHDRGGASGLRWYQMQLEEEGDLVTSTTAQVLTTLFDGLTTWSAVSDAIETYANVPALVQAAASIPNIAIAQFNATVAAVQDAIVSAQAITGGFTPPARLPGLAGSSDDSVTPAGTNPTLVQRPRTTASLFSQSEELGATLESFVDAVTVNAPRALDEEMGAVNWARQEGEASNPALDAQEQIEELEELADALAWQPVAGVLFGWDREEYRAYIEGQTEGGRANDLEGSISYTVRDVDTAERIEAKFGVPFDRILDLNGLTPDEALLGGTTLEVPIIRGRGNPQTIDGLPTLGSHVGRAALGADALPGFDVDSRGDLIIREGTELLEQGIDWLFAELGDALLPLVNQAPPVIRSRLLQLQVERLILLDRRIVGIDEVVVEERPDTATFAIGLRATAINGAELATGIVS